jgi:hypothetical protein
VGRLFASISAIVALVGCTPSAPEGAPVVAPSVTVAAVAPAAPKAKAPEVEPVAVCEAAIDRAAALTPADAFQTIAEGCADVFSRKECREAFRRAPHEPIEGRAAFIAKGCAAAYCPHLASPVPSLCDDRDEALAPTALAPLWAELYERILVADLGAAAAARLLERHRVRAEARRWVPPDNEPECHPSCCPPALQTPAPDGTVECCLCD